jgi:hypothetical protein
MIQGYCSVIIKTHLDFGINISDDALENFLIFSVIVDHKDFSDHNISFKAKNEMWLERRGTGKLLPKGFNQIVLGAMKVRQTQPSFTALSIYIFGQGILTSIEYI